MKGVCWNGNGRILIFSIPGISVDRSINGRFSVDSGGPLSIISHGHDFKERSKKKVLFLFLFLFFKESSSASKSNFKELKS